MFETRFTFDGAFQTDSQKDSVPYSLLALVNMILDGENINHQTQLSNTSITTTALKISQLLVFNSVSMYGMLRQPRSRGGNSTPTLLVPRESTL